MKKILLGAILLIIIMVVVLFGKIKPFAKRSSSFSVDWVDDITKIKITEDDKILILTKQNNLWFVNGDSEVRLSAIGLIIKTLKEIKIKSPISDTLYKEIAKENEKRTTKVEVSGKGAKKFSFYIYKNTSNEFGSIFKLKLSSKPYFVFLPGYESDPGLNFVCDQIYWLPYHIFKLNPENITFISMTKYVPVKEQFEIEIKENILSLTINGILSSKSKTEKLKRYISYFSFIPFENWKFGFDNSTKNKIITARPAIKINVELVDGTKQILKLWTKNKTSTKPSKQDTDRLYGELNNSGNIFIVRYYDIDPIIKSLDYFITD